LEEGRAEILGKVSVDLETVAEERRTIEGKASEPRTRVRPRG
jgi:hypothetical protein